MDFDYRERKYRFELVFVIDATNNGQIAQNVKDSVLSSADMFAKELNDYDNGIEVETRIKLIFFGDYKTEGKNAIIQSEFVDIPDGKEYLAAQFERDDIKMNGGDASENGLEALYEAMRSDFKYSDRKIRRKRQIIIVISDAYPLKLHERADCDGYDKEYFPANIQELQNVWDFSGDADSISSLSYSKKMLCLCVPDVEDYHGRSWYGVFEFEYSLLFPIERNGGATDLCMEKVVRDIVCEIKRS